MAMDSAVTPEMQRRVTYMKQWSDWEKIKARVIRSLKKTPVVSLDVESDISLAGCEDVGSWSRAKYLLFGFPSLDVLVIDVQRMRSITEGGYARDVTPRELFEMMEEGSVVVAGSGLADSADDYGEYEKDLRCWGFRIATLCDSQHIYRWLRRHGKLEADGDRTGIGSQSFAIWRTNLKPIKKGWSQFEERYGTVNVPRRAWWRNLHSLYRWERPGSMQQDAYLLCDAYTPIVMAIWLVREVLLAEGHNTDPNCHTAKVFRRRIEAITFAGDAPPTSQPKTQKRTRPVTVSAQGTARKRANKRGREDTGEVDPEAREPQHKAGRVTGQEVANDWAMRMSVDEQARRGILSKALRCKTCHSARHGHPKRPATCPFEERLEAFEREMGSPFRQCSYRPCQDVYNHRTVSCPELHHVCKSCGLRGHGLAVVGCPSSEPNLFAMRSMFEQCADDGHLTRARREDPRFGFYQLGEGVHLVEGGYDALTAMPVELAVKVARGDRASDWVVKLEADPLEVRPVEEVLGVEEEGK